LLDSKPKRAKSATFNALLDTDEFV